MCPGQTRQAEPGGGLCGGHSGGRAGTGVSRQCPSQPSPPLLLSVQAQERNVGSGRYWPLGALLACPCSLPSSDPTLSTPLTKVGGRKTLPFLPCQPENQPPKALRHPQGTWVSGQDRFPGHPAGREMAGIRLAGRATKPVSHRKRPAAAQAAELRAPHHHHHHHVATFH